MAVRRVKGSKKKQAPSPQEKKRLSLTRDRRNTYGESPHASRKNVPKRRAKRNRSVRRAVHQAIAAEDLADNPLDRVLGKDHQGWRWKKSPDEPLGEVLKAKRRRRARPT